MESSNKPFCCWVLLAFLILSCFVAQTHGWMMRERLLHPYKFTLKPYFGVDDTNLFEAIDDVVDETNINVLIPQEGSKEKDRIERLPGQPPVNFSQYGGYVTVDKSAGRALYYYFVEAQHSKDTMPLLLWLNGGPGCSSLAYGAMQELGPFRVLSDGKTLFTNKFSWNSAANVLFLESPAGVGFSYSNTTSDYNKMEDRNIAMDNYVFLVNWLERYPEYKNRAFYISGESYAGHYVPQLAQIILYNNKKANKTIINLKGIIIGNAVMNFETDTQGMYDYLATHAIASDRDVSEIRQRCIPFKDPANISLVCSAAMNVVNSIMFDIDLYNIYAPLCISPNTTFQPKKASIFKFDPCSDNYVYAYMNRPEVQEALHANVTKLTHDWQSCSDVLNFTGIDPPSTIIPLLREFMANALRVWIYSGDVDGVVPVTATKYSINSMSLPVKTAWHSWFLNKEVGGYTELYEGDLTLVTVRGAGHQVPSYQPARALSLIKHFLDGMPLPGTKIK